MQMLKLEDVSYVYQKGSPFEKEALKNVNITVEDGEFVGLIGHTGSGKSTLIQLFNGLLKPSSGRVLIDGVDIGTLKSLRDIRFKVGLVMQYPEYQLFEETVYKDIAFGPRNMGLSEEETDRRVRFAASMVGLSDAALEKSPFEMSGGQKRRAAIAGILAMEPKILVLDEPTAGLDPSGRDEILFKIKDMHARTGATVILVTHSMEDVARLAERIIVMNKGALAMDGSVRKVFSRGAELEKMGLAVPQVTKITDNLRERVPSVKKGIFTVREAEREIAAALREGEVSR